MQNAGSLLWCAGCPGAARGPSFCTSGLSCLLACGTSVPWPGIKHSFHALEGGFLTLETPGKFQLFGVLRCLERGRGRKGGKEGRRREREGRGRAGGKCLCICEERENYRVCTMYKYCLEHLTYPVVIQSVVSNSNPMECSTPGIPVLHHLPELAQIHVHRVSDAIQPSHPLSSPSLPAFNLS